MSRVERLAVSDRGRVDVLVRRCALLGLARSLASRWRRIPKSRRCYGEFKSNAPERG
jgi:hypothetical protein